MAGKSAKSATRGTLARSFQRSLLTAALVPMLVAVLLLVAYDLYARRARFVDGLSTSVELSAHQVQQFIDTHRSVIEALGKLDSPAYDGVARRLELLRQSVPTFRSLMAIDRSGRVAAGVPAHRADGTTVDWGVGSVTDREYFSAVIERNASHVSNVYRGRFLSEDALVAISAPVRNSAGDVVGVFQGAIVADAVARQRARILEDRGLQLLVLDAQDGIVYASRALALAAGDRLDDRAIGAAIDDALATGNRSLVAVKSQRVDGSAYVAVAKLQNGWRLVTFAQRQALLGNLASGAIVVGVIALVALAFLTWFARSWTRRTIAPLRALADHMQTYAFADELEPLQPSDAFREVAQVQKGYNVLVARLRTAYDEKEAALGEQRALADQLNEAVTDREREIARRTQELNVALAALREQSLTCGLTGLANYRSMRMKCDEMHTRARARQRSMVAIAIDIDHFKLYNDTYGHPAGDRCLKQVSDALRAIAAGAGAHLGRVGGEEFQCLVEQVDADEARAIAEAMREAVESLAIPHRASPHSVVTISVGVAKRDPDTAEDDVEILLTYADQALYRAKREGRNRVCTA